MASTKKYLEFILGQLSSLEEITSRAMMGEFIIYYLGKIVGGIYDDRFLINPVRSAKAYMPVVSYELPYEGGKEMLLVDYLMQCRMNCRCLKPKNNRGIGQYKYIHTLKAVH